MPLRVTAASSSTSRIQKPTTRRSSSSPFSASKRRKPASQTTRKKSVQADDDEELFGTRLGDDGLIASLAGDLEFSDVAQLIRYIADHQWSSIPETGVGMNSTRIAEVLNYRARLPPI